MRKIIAERIKQAREERELTQKQVALYLGLQTPNAISEIERENVDVSAEYLYKLAELFNKPLLYFYGKDFEDKTTEDILGVIEQMTQEEREEMVKIANNTSKLRILAAEFKSTKGKRKRSLASEIYNKVLEYLLPVNNIRREGIELKKQLEEEMGLDEE